MSRLKIFFFVLTVFSFSKTFLAEVPSGSVVHEKLDSDEVSHEESSVSQSNWQESLDKLSGLSDGKYWNFQKEDLTDRWIKSSINAAIEENKSVDDLVSGLKVKVEAELLKISDLTGGQREIKTSEIIAKFIKAFELTQKDIKDLQQKFRLRLSQISSTWRGYLNEQWKKDIVSMTKQLIQFNVNEKYINTKIREAIEGYNNGLYRLQASYTVSINEVKNIVVEAQKLINEEKNKRLQKNDEYLELTKFLNMIINSPFNTIYQNFLAKKVYFLVVSGKDKKTIFDKIDVALQKISSEDTRKYVKKNIESEVERIEKEKNKEVKEELQKQSQQKKQEEQKLLDQKKFEKSQKREKKLQEEAQQEKQQQEKTEDLKKIQKELESRRLDYKVTSSGIQKIYEEYHAKKVKEEEEKKKFIADLELEQKEVRRQDPFFEAKEKAKQEWEEILQERQKQRQLRLNPPQEELNRIKREREEWQQLSQRRAEDERKLIASLQKKYPLPVVQSVSKIESVEDKYKRERAKKREEKLERYFNTKMRLEKEEKEKAKLKSQQPVPLIE